MSSSSDQLGRGADPQVAAAFSGIGEEGGEGGSGPSSGLMPNQWRG